MMRRWVVLGFVVGLAGCASYGAKSNLTKAYDRFQAIIPVGEAMQYDMIDPKLAGTEKEKQTAKLIEANVYPIYSAKLSEAATKAFDGVDRYNFTPRLEGLQSYARELDAFFSDAIRPYGATGYVMLKTKSGEYIKASEYFGKMSVALGELRAASERVEASRESSREIWGAIAQGLAAGAASYSSSNSNPYANPQQVYIAPYVKTDGEAVQGHMRTVPNYTPVDNLSYR